ncbi:MAG: hypothetical protein HY364_04240 [Candidatus Aenigmarchaeota archaeon]|nr:hypothetical protein [Candidatus Aenigmarchaeota archaeon]
MGELINILKFIEKDYKYFSEVRKHFNLNEGEAQIVWDRYFEKGKYIQPKDSSGSGSHQRYTASDEGKGLLEENSLFNRVTLRQIIAGTIIAVVSFVLGTLL